MSTVDALAIATGYVCSTGGYQIIEDITATVETIDEELTATISDIQVL